MNKKKKIIIATGGTGGHVFPALSLSEELKKNFEVKIISDKRGLRYFKNKENIKLINSATIFEKNLFKLIINLNKITFSIINAFFYLLKAKPQVVFGMGGYSSFPICVASFFLKIPIIIYENNLVLGRTNRILLPIAKKIFVSKMNISGIKKKYSNKVFNSGYFLRKEIFEIKKNNNKKANQELSILIIGGSQSAKVFGEKIPEIIVNCSKNHIKFNVYQQCMDKQIDEIKQIYERHKIDVNLFSFSDNLSDYFRDSDLAITRAGASSMAELLNLRIPFIAIPLPSSVENHQLKNAENFQKHGYCFLLEEKFIIPKLFEILKDLNKNREKLHLLKNKMHEYSDKDVLSKVNKFIEKFLNEKN